MQYYSALKRRAILTYATLWMDLEDIILSEINQSHTHTHTNQHMYDSTYMFPRLVKFIEKVE